MPCAGTAALDTREPEGLPTAPAAEAEEREEVAGPVASDHVSSTLSEISQSSTSVFSDESVVVEENEGTFLHLTFDSESEYCSSLVSDDRIISSSESSLINLSIVPAESVMSPSDVQSSVRSL